MERGWVNERTTSHSSREPAAFFVICVYFCRKSSLLWAQDGSYQERFYEGNWSWSKAREHYYTALTGRDFGGNALPADEVKRKEYFARTFRGLGHQMHLLQDTAVPDHVRNDAHPEDALFGKSAVNGSRYFETWTKERIRNLNEMTSFTPTVISPNLLLNISRQNLAPITQFYDTDLYDGLNASAGINQGLAEYTNANFFSGDTIYAAERYASGHRHYLPFPRRSSTDLSSFIDGTKSPETIVDERGNARTGIWVSKVSDGEDVSHFVRTSSLTSLAYTIFGEGEVFYSTFYRDEKCHEDYARVLIPRAVGYSAALLDYFFRGKMEISLPTAGIYATTNDAGVGFTQITLFAKNTTSNGDEMTGGTIELVVKYKLAQSDPFQSTQVGKSEFRYIVVPEANNITSIPRDSRVELTFDLSQTPLPVNATDVYLQLVYHGKLGSEDGAVAVGFKDISEPTPIDVFNNMDKICINNGTSTGWYDAGSQSAIQLVDKNGDHIAYGTDEWDVYPHDLTLYVKFYNSSIEPEYASPSSYDYLIENLPAGAPMRALYVLGDEKVDYSFYTVRTAVDANDYWGHVDFLSLYYGDTVKNQEGDFPVLYNFRNFKMWSGAGFIYINPSYPDDNAQCPLNGL
jgi:hypothetical protein